MKFFNKQQKEEEEEKNRETCNKEHKSKHLITNSSLFGFKYASNSGEHQSFLAVTNLFRHL